MVSVDLRGLPTWERTGVVTGAFNDLPGASAMTIITENEPRGLSVWLAQVLDADIMLDPRRVGNAEWHITLQRAHPNGDAVSPEVVLKRSAVFRDLPPAAIEALAASATLQGSRRGAAIVPENRDWPFVGVLFEGVVALSSGAETTRARIFYEVIPYETFGEMEFFDRGMSIGRTVVLTKHARYVRIGRDAVAHVGLEYPSLLLSLGRVCAQRGRLLAGALAAQAAQPILARIAAVLIRYASPEQGLSIAVPPLPTLTQAQIAASAGTVKEVAARAIAELENRGLLKREHGHIKQLDRQRLLDLVRGPS